MFRVTRERKHVRSGKTSVEHAYGITSLSHEEASPERFPPVFFLSTGGHSSRTRTTADRDTAFREDACLMRGTGHGPGKHSHRPSATSPPNATDHPRAMTYGITSLSLRTGPASPPCVALAPPPASNRSLRVAPRQCLEARHRQTSTKDLTPSRKPASWHSPLPKDTERQPQTSCESEQPDIVCNRHFMLGRAIPALCKSLLHLMMTNAIRAEIRDCRDLTDRLSV